MVALRIDGGSDIGRHCGECTLCCRLVPVKELHKPGGTRCTHQRAFKGCAIYATRPASCRIWSCMWYLGLDGEPIAGLRRPDHSHYVIDPIPDYVTAVNPETGERQRVDVVQVWIDPRYPDCHRDPALRAFLEKVERVAVIRTSEETMWGIIVPPALNETGQWYERPSRAGDSLDPVPHTLANVFGVTP